MPFSVITGFVLLGTAAAQVIIGKRRRSDQKRRAEREREASRGQEVNISGSASSISVHYGYTITEGIRVFVDTSRGFTFAPDSNNIIFPATRGLHLQSRDDEGNYRRIEATKNEYLLTQTVLGAGTIHDVRDINVDDNPIDFSEYLDTITIEITRLSDPPAANVTADSFTTLRTMTDVFTNTSYATSVFKLNREAPQFSGVPNTVFFIHGNRIRTIASDLSEMITFSNNAVWVLLDYLTNDVYGYGLLDSQIDLQSFIRAAAIANEVVETSIFLGGKVYNDMVTRPIRRYEFNGSLSTDNSHAANIEKILTVMPGSYFFRGIDGLYKITLAPSTGMIEDYSVMSFNEDSLVSDIAITYPDSDVKLNSFVTRYLNAEIEFAQDSLTIVDNLNNGQVYLDDDEMRRLEGNELVDGINNRYAAYNFGHQRIKESRLKSYEFEINAQGLLLEPGDVIRIQDDLSDIDEYVIIDTIRGTAQFTFSIIAIEASVDTYAWLSPASIVVRPSIPFDFTVGIPINLRAAYNMEEGFVDITWSPSPDETASVYGYIVEFKLGTEDTYTTLSTVFSTSYRYEVAIPNEYDYRVYALTNDGRRSEPSTPVTLLATEFTVTTPNINSVVSEEYTPFGELNVKTRLIVTWSEARGRNVRYELEWKLSTETEYQTSGLVASRRFVINDAVLGRYDLRIRALSEGTASPYTTFNYTLSFMGVPPEDIMNLSIDTVEGVAFLSWDELADSSLRISGTIRIKHSPLTSGATWEDAVEIIPAVSAVTTTHAIPNIPGTYLVKAINMENIESINAASVVSVETNYRRQTDVLTVTENPTYSGAKQDLEVITSPISGLRVRAIAPNTFFTGTAMYTFANRLDLDAVYNTRLSVNIDITASDEADMIDDRETDIDTWTDFDGGNVQGVNAYIEARYTNDDPDGSPTWSDWQRISVVDRNMRAAEFRAVVVNTYSNIALTIRSLSVTASLANKVFSGTVTTSSGRDTIVNYGEDFYNIPNINVTILNELDGQRAIVTNKTRTGFTLTVRVGNSRIAQAVDWTAVGV